MSATSKHLAIRAAVAALFLAATPLAGGRVFQNREFILPEGVDSQIHVNRVESDPNADVITGAPIDWTTTLEVVIKTRQAASTGAPGADAETVADQLWTDAYARLMADASLGGLAMQLTQGVVTFEQDTVDTGVAVITWRFTVLHRTANNVIS